MKLTKTSVLMIGLLLIICLAATAAAQTRGKRRGIKKEILIPPAAFTPSNLAPGNGYFLNLVPGGYLTGDPDPCSAVAPVIFPKGAKRIRDIVIYVWDQNSNGSALFTLQRLELETGVTLPLGAVESEDSAGIVDYELPLSDRTIESGYVYYITANIDPLTFLYGVLVTY